MRQASKNAEKSAGGGGNGSKHWSEDDLQLLIKAVNLFAAGTNSRWEVIANYMNIHSSSGVKRTAKDVIGKAKSLQKLGELVFAKRVSLLPEIRILKVIYAI